MSNYKNGSLLTYNKRRDSSLVNYVLKVQFGLRIKNKVINDTCHFIFLFLKFLFSHFC